MFWATWGRRTLNSRQQWCFNFGRSGHRLPFHVTLSIYLVIYIPRSPTLISHHSYAEHHTGCLDLPSFIWTSYFLHWMMKQLDVFGYLRQKNSELQTSMVLQFWEVQKQAPFLCYIIYLFSHLYSKVTHSNFTSELCWTSYWLSRPP